MQTSIDFNLPVWLYWEGEYPDWIKACHETIFTHATDVRLVTPAIFDSLRDTDRDIDLSRLCIAHRADFIRAFLLAKFGGLWIDSDCIVMKSLEPLINNLKEYDFISFKQRQGDISNSFIGAQANSIIAGDFYHRICTILRSEQPIEWLTIGSQALAASIKKTGAAWYEIDVTLIQPICWSCQEPFFEICDVDRHRLVFNEHAYCYMLSGSMIMGYIRKNPTQNLLDEQTFLKFLLKKSYEQKIASIIQNMAYRKHTDDDMWVIPEVIEQDMYRVKDVLSKLVPSTQSYVIDCGAHIGAFSIICATYIKNIDIIAFEPNPDSFIYLNQNVKRFTHVKSVNKAVGIEAGRLNLYPPDQKEWTGRWHTLPNSNEPIEVEAINLFAFIKNLDKPVFLLKLDLEGYEELIINNSTEEDLAHIQILILETHTNNIDHDKLLNCGFKLLFQPHISSERQFVYTRNAKD